MDELIWEEEATHFSTLTSFLALENHRNLRTGV